MGLICAKEIFLREIVRLWKGNDTHKKSSERNRYKFDSDKRNVDEYSIHEDYRNTQIGKENLRSYNENSRSHKENIRSSISVNVSNER